MNRKKIAVASLKDRLNLDLRIETLARACKGNVKALPSFMVHDNSKWPWNKAQLDSKNRIHLRRSTFLAVVAAELPVRAGLWLGKDVQEFFLDLKPHHLQGSEDAPDPAGYKHSREITKTDAQGRNPGDDGYGERNAPLSLARLKELRLDLERAKAEGQSLSVRSSVLDGPGSE